MLMLRLVCAPADEKVTVALWELTQALSGVLLVNKCFK